MKIKIQNNKDTKEVKVLIYMQKKHKIHNCNQLRITYKIIIVIYFKFKIIHKL